MSRKPSTLPKEVLESDSNEETSEQEEGERSPVKKQKKSALSSRKKK